MPLTADSEFSVVVPVPPPRPRLSILICSLHARSALLGRLLAALSAQSRAAEVEVLVAVDGGHVPTGAKRNRLVAQATGEYVVHIDDDDLVSDRYIPAVLEALETFPGVDAVLIRGCRTQPGRPAVVFDYAIGVEEGHAWSEVLWRSPGHLCPIRSQIARSVRFPEKTHGEDSDWGRAIAALLKTEQRAGAPDEILYHYLYAPSTAPVAPSRWATAPYDGFVKQFLKAHADVKTVAEYHGHGDHWLGADLVLCKDVLSCWPTPAILGWLRSVAEAPCKYVLVTHDNYGIAVNAATPPGVWRSLDLTKPPFSVGTLVLRWGKPNKDVVLIRGAR